MSEGFKNVILSKSVWIAFVACEAVIVKARSGIRAFCAAYLKGRLSHMR
jgi:hypothetical protein